MAPLRNALVELKVKPSLQLKDPSPVSEVTKFLEDLQSTQENVLKKACFDLKFKLKVRENVSNRDVIFPLQDERFAKEFKQQNGVSFLGKLIQRSKGNTLAYSLSALEAYMAIVTDYNFLGTSLMEKIVSTIFDPNLNPWYFLYSYNSMLILIVVQ